MGCQSKEETDLNTRRLIICILICLSFVFIVSCKKEKTKNGAIKDYTENNKTYVTLTPTKTPTIPADPITIVPEENHEGQMRSYLTGLWVDEEIGKKRPYAYQFSNFKTVRNQWGIGQADIVYECLVEGGITRLLGIGENYSGDRIGSTRSSRHYFASIADEYDAIYIHYGKTKYAKKKLKDLGIDNLDGETGIGTTVFYRDNSLKAPHNAFASLEGILKGIEKKGYETLYEANYEPHFSFYETDTDLSGGSTANKVTVHFTPSSYNKPYFEYNKTDKLYYRYQFNEAHKDSLTGEQLSFKNLIIQFVKEWDIDKNGYQDMELADASGKGYYISNGTMVEITWKKKEATGWMRYYNKDGEELTINPGKTYIALFPDKYTKGLIIE